MEYESAEPKVNGASVHALMSEPPEVVRQLLQVSHKQGGNVHGSWPTYFVLGTVPDSTTVKHSRTSVHIGNYKFGDSSNVYM